MAKKRSINWRRWTIERPWLWVVLLAALLPLTWFGGAYLVTGTDINFPLDPIWRLVSRFSLWDPSFITGRDQSVALPTQVFAGVQAALASLGLGNTLIEQFELVFWLGASGVAALFFLSQLLASQKDDARRWGITLGVTVYLFNLFLVNRINEIDVATLGAYVLVPALLGFGLAVRNGQLKFWQAGLGAALVSLLGVGLFANPPLVFVVTLFLAAWTFVLLVTQNRSQNIEYLKFLGVFTVSFGFIHLWWLIPYFNSLHVLVGGDEGLGGLNLLNWVDGVSRHTSFWNVLRMQGAWDWFEVGIEDKPYFPPAALYRFNPMIITLSLILPLGAVLSAKSRGYFDKTGRALWWLMLTTLLVSLIYSMGTNNLVSRWLYDVTSETVPYFWLIRSPWYKFGYLTTLAYTILFSFLGVWLVNRIKSVRWQRWVLGGLTIGIILYAFPMLLGSTQLFPYTRLKSSAPDYVTDTTNYLNAQPDTHRLVTLPQEEAYNYTWGYGSGGDVISHFLRRPVLANETFAGGNRHGADLLLESFYRSVYDTISTESVRLLDYLDGFYFVHKNDSKYADYGESDSPEFIREQLAKQEGIEFDRTFGEWDLYKRTDAPPGRITTSTRLWTIFGNETDNVKTLPYILKHLPTDPQPVQFYIRPPEDEPGPGTVRNVLTKDLPILEGESLIKRLDFDAPFAGAVTNERLIGSASGTLELNGIRARDGGRGTLQLEDNTLEASDDILPNIIKNPSFADPVELGFPGPGPWEFSDSSKTLAGDPKFAVKRVAGIDDTPGLQLTATNHILALHQKIDDFEPRSIYRLSFDYRHVQGQAPSFATWQLTSAVDEPNGTLPPSSEWQHHETFIATDVRSTGLLVYFYAGAENGQTTINEYDNIRVEKVGTRTTFAFFSDETEFAPAPAVSFEQVSQTKWTATVQPSSTPYLLSFLETYHPGWVASANGTAIEADRHVKVSGYANAWYVDAHAEPITYEIVYQPQTRFALYGWISLGTMALIIAALWLYRTRATAKKSH